MSDLETSLSEDKNKKRKSEIELTEEEKKCKKFFNRMKIPRIKSEVWISEYWSLIIFFSLNIFISIEIFLSQ